MRKLKCF